MYAVETAKMSSRGQLVIPDAFRKNYGWTAGMTLLMIGTDDAVVLQPLQMPSETSVGRILSEARSAGNEIAERVKRARDSLAKLERMGISLPEGVEKGAARRAFLREKQRSLRHGLLDLQISRMRSSPPARGTTGAS